MSAEQYAKNLSIGLGEAVERLVNLHTRVTCGLASKEEHEERKMLLSAMNVIPLHLDFSCNIARAPTTISMFEKSASTSCCRLVPPETVRTIRASGTSTPVAEAPAIPIATPTPPKSGSRR